MANDRPAAKEVRDEIEREIVRVHDEAYGGAVENVDVVLGQNVIAIALDIRFNRAEQTLVDAGSGEAVRYSREEFQTAIAPTFCAIVERATGRTVDAFASRMVIDPPWSIEVFRLGPEAAES
jgi:uncharacterized protein YbcI